jgi:hypothetical protein
MPAAALLKSALTREKRSSVRASRHSSGIGQETSVAAAGSVPPRTSMSPAVSI